MGRYDSGRPSAECGMGNAELNGQGRSQRKSPCNSAFHTPHSAFRIDSLLSAESRYLIPAHPVPPWGRPNQGPRGAAGSSRQDRKSTRLNSSHGYISYAVFCLKKKITSHAALRSSYAAIKPILEARGILVL